MDQFAENIGSFGTITVEAMSCGIPVITYIDSRVYGDWTQEVFPILPPIYCGFKEKEILSDLDWLVEETTAREHAGEVNKAWIELYHSKERVTNLYKDFINYES